jgi:argininosuccinate lyase
VASPLAYREPLLGLTRPEITRYTSSIEDDKLIVCEVLEVLEAHLEELVESKVVPLEPAKRILSEVESLKRDPSKLFTYNVEDVHEAIEVYLGEKLGVEAGYLALGRSRNDHVAAALRLKVSRLLIEEGWELLKLRRILLVKALEHRETPMVLYTHTQPAQISTLAHYLLYVDELIATYLELLPSIISVTLRSPLGSGPAAGVSTPIDRVRIASKLFNGGIVYNSLYATTSRDFALLALAFNASLLASLSRVVEDLILLSTPQIGYFSIPEEHLATSSIMPHKRNPVTLEITRARIAELLASFVAVAGIIKGLTSGYNLDMQEANRHAIEPLVKTIEALRILGDLLSRLRVNVENVVRDVKAYPIALSDLAELIAIRTGRPFREVHREIAGLIKESKGVEEVYKVLEEKYGVRLDYRSVIRRPVVGSSNPEDVDRYVEKAYDSLRSLEEALERYSYITGRRCSH